jgi:hypothetical protein
MANTINTKLGEYRKVINGITTDKRNARAALAQSSFTTMSSVRSYALQNDMQDLAAQMDVNLSELQTMAYQMLIFKIESAQPVVQPLVPQLADFNITPASFLAWQTDLQTMKDLLTSTSSAIKHRKALGETIQSDMQDAMSFLENQTEPLIANFISTQPDYYREWFTMRRIDITGIHHTRLFATVQNEIGNPVFGATVTVDLYTDPDTGKTYQPVSAVTTPEGTCLVSAFFPGMRTVTISGNGIVTKTFPAIEFKKAQQVDMIFEVQPQFNIPAPQPTPENVNNN